MQQNLNAIITQHMHEYKQTDWDNVIKQDYLTDFNVLSIMQMTL